MSQFDQDMTSDDTWVAVGKDHEYAKEAHNIFGVPTLTFNGKKPVYVKLASLPTSQDEQMVLFESITTFAVKQPHLLELKRPDLKQL